MTFFQYYSSAIATLSLAMFGYVASLGNRVQALETTVQGQQKKDDDIKEFMRALLDAKFEGLDKRLERIERNGNGHAHA